MSKIKLLLEVVSDLRSLANSLQAVADAVAQGGQEQPDQTTEEKPAQKPEKKTVAKKEELPTEKAGQQSKMCIRDRNTVRLYEKCGLIPKPERLENGYRVFTDLHIEQFKLARAALQVEVLQNGLRKQAVDIIKVSALRNYEKAMESVSYTHLDVYKRQDPYHSRISAEAGQRTEALHSGASRRI